MSTAYEEPYDADTTALPQLEVVPTMQPESIRLLGAASLGDTPSKLYDHVVRRADTLTAIQTKDFAHLMHTVLMTRVEQVNTSNGVRPESFQVRPTQVTKNIDLYYRVFGSRAEGPLPPYLERQRQAYLTANIATATEKKNLAASPEIRLLVRLRDSLAEHAGELASDTATELLAAYGWALDSRRAETHMQFDRLARDLGQ